MNLDALLYIIFVAYLFYVATASKALSGAASNGRPGSDTGRVASKFRPVELSPLDVIAIGEACEPEGELEMERRLQ